jgi:hypothetical protein
MRALRSLQIRWIARASHTRIANGKTFDFTGLATSRLSRHLEMRTWWIGGYRTEESFVAWFLFACKEKRSANFILHDLLVRSLPYGAPEGFGGSEGHQSYVYSTYNRLGKIRREKEKEKTEATIDQGRRVLSLQTTNQSPYLYPKQSRRDGRESPSPDPGEANPVGPPDDTRRKARR